MKILANILFLFCVISSSLYAHSWDGHKKDFVNVFEGLQGKKIDTVYRIISSGIDSEYFKLNGKYCRKYSFVHDFNKKFGSLPKGNHRLIGHWGFEGAIPFSQKPYKTALSPYPKNEVIQLWKTYVNKVTHKIAALTGLPPKQAKALGGIIYNIHLLGDYSTVYTEPLPSPQYIAEDLIKNFNRLWGNNNNLSQKITNELNMLDKHLSPAEYAKKVQEILAQNNIGEKIKKYSPELNQNRISRGVSGTRSTAGIKNSFNKFGNRINIPQGPSVFSDSLQTSEKQLSVPRKSIGRQNRINNTQSNRNRLRQHSSSTRKFYKIGGGAAIAGVIIINDAIGEGVTPKTFLKAGGAFTLFPVIIEGSLQNELVAKGVLTALGKNISKKATTQMGQIIASWGSKSFIVLDIGVTAYQIGSVIYLYNKGSISQTEMLVKTGLSSAVLLGMGVGFVFGGPAGAVFGGAIAAISGVGDCIYDYYANKQRQENILSEIRRRSDWESKNKRIRFEKTLLDLERESNQMRLEAWRGLGCAI